MQSLSLADTGRRDGADELHILAASPPEPTQAQRLQAVEQRVAAVGSAQETLLRRIDAQVQQTFAKRRQHMLPGAPFTALFEASADNLRSGFRPLRQAAQDHLDVARAWREVADHHAVAIGAAEKFGVADVSRTATEAKAFCEASAVRDEMLGHMLSALATSRRGLSQAELGNFRALELASTALRAVIEQARGPRLELLLGVGFEQQLGHMVADALGHLGRAGAAGGAHAAQIVPLAFRAASKRPVWQAKVAAAALELVQVAGSLRAALQGDPQALASPAPSLPSLLRAAEGAEERAARHKPAQDSSQALGAWFAALDAHADLPDAVAQASARTPADTLQAQGVQALRQHVDQGLGRVQDQVRGLLEGAVAALHTDLRAADAAGDSDLRGLQAAARGIAQRAGQLQALVSTTAVLQRPALKQALPAQTLAQPFAVLQQAAQAVAAAAARFGTKEATELNRAAAAAQAAAAVPGALAAKPMGELAAFCSQLAMDVLSTADIGHEAAKAFLAQVSQVALPAGRRLEALLTGLQDLPAVHPPRAEPHPGLGDARLHIDQMLEVARQAQAATTLAALPDDAPPQALATQRATRLMLRATSVAASAVAESLSICQQALDALPRAAPHQRTAIAQDLAERSRTTGTTVAGALAEHIDFSTAGLPEHLTRVVNEQGARLRHTERLAQRVRVPLQALALMAEAQSDADAFRAAARALPPSQAIARIGQAGRQFRQAEMVLKAGAQQLVSRIHDEKAPGNTAATHLLDAEALAVTRAFDGLAFRAGREHELAQGRLLVDLAQRTLADPVQVKSLGRAGVSQLVEHVQQHLQASSQMIESRLRERGNEDMARPLQENVAGLLQELQACRAQLASAASAEQQRLGRRR